MIHKVGMRRRQVLQLMGSTSAVLAVGSIAAPPVFAAPIANRFGDVQEVLDTGADAYLSKPFGLAELQARVRALLRRQQSSDVVLDGGDIQLDTRGRRVLADGTDIVLANREFDLLRFLMERSGQVVSRDEILTEVWGSADLRSSKTLDMHISWLRRKIGDDQYDRPRHIVTVRGVGFRFDP